MNFEGVVIDLVDLTRSIDFYCEVLGFTVLSQEDQLAAVSAPGNDRAQFVVRRALGRSSLGGRHTTGLRAFRSPKEQRMRYSMASWPASTAADK